MKKTRLRPLAELVEECIAPALAAQGFAASDVVVAWPEIVGERLAPYCEPVKLQWPKRPKGMAPDEPSEPAVLVVRVEGAFALELQHLAPLIVERVNTRYGWRCVGRLSFRQGPVGRDRTPKPAVRLPDARQVEEARRRVGEVEDEGLREALVRLGAGIMARKDG